MKKFFFLKVFWLRTIINGKSFLARRKKKNLVKKVFLVKKKVFVNKKNLVKKFICGKQNLGEEKKLRKTNYYEIFC